MNKKTRAVAILLVAVAHIVLTKTRKGKYFLSLVASMVIPYL